ncbi:MAG: hypothetical protein JWR83_216 [Aeromicrobium sp.]|nr:hypothetical protein [Aeromicrobium sp.]
MTTNLTKGGSRWPTGTDYARAIQNADMAFSDGVLQSSKAAVNGMGMPLVASGQNAVVFLLGNAAGDQAVRCFTTPPTEGSSRYHALSAHLDSSPPTAVTASRWLDDGIHVDGGVWPVVVMPWVEGRPFNLVVEDLAADGPALERMAAAWVAMVLDLQAADVTHGDLQHGNVLVRDDGEFCLVDLDGSWVPTMQVGAPDELGHPNYQHPRRSSAQWGRHGDSFSALVVETGLLALAADPGLEQFLSGENVLFNRADLVDTDSKLWKALEASPDPEVVQLVGVLKARAKNHPDSSMLPYNDLRAGQVAAPSLPTFDALPSSLSTLTDTSASADTSWWQGSGVSAPSVLAPLAQHASLGGLAGASGGTAPVVPIVHVGSVTPVTSNATSISAPPSPSVKPSTSAKPDPVTKPGAASTTSATRRGVGAVLGRDAAVSGAIGGGVAAFLGSLLAGVVNLGVPSPIRPGIYVTVVSLMLGALLVGWQAITSGAYKAALRRIGIGALLGTAAGLLAMIPANLMFVSAQALTRFNQTTQKVDVISSGGYNVFDITPIRSGLAWMFVATFVGILIGAINGRKAALAAGVVGAIAGLIGGTIFGANVARFHGHLLVVNGFEPATFSIVTGIGVLIGLAIGASTRVMSRGRLVIIEGKHLGMETLLPAKVGTIGSAPRDTLVLVGDKAVAAQHVSIDMTRASPLLTVLPSRDPIRVNGTETRDAILKDGDVLAIGASFVRFEWKGSDT